MSLHPIRLLGDPALRSSCETISKPGSMAARVVIDDTAETLRSVKQRLGYGRGLSAPQIGAPVRIVCLELDKPLVLIVEPDPAPAQWARRAHLDEEADFEGDTAALVQHEIDHLDGVLIVDRPHGLDPFCCRSEWEKRYAGHGRFSDPEQRTATYATPLGGMI